MHDDASIERLAEAIREARTTRSEVLRRALVAGVGLSAFGSLAAACGGSKSSGSGNLPKAGGDIKMADLVKKAEGEGKLNVIALPRDWSNYGEMLDTFAKLHPKIKVTSASPDISSAEENQAVKSLKGQKRAPDCVDVGPAFAASGATSGLYATYKNSQWDSIPDFMKEKDGLWTGDYYGVISIGANTDATGGSAPAEWADLKDPKYKGKVALNGDPTKAGAAFAGVYSAALANGGSLDDIGPGIQFFADLKKMGNFIPVEATAATIQNGQTPITIDWDYLQIGYNKEFAGKLTWKVAIPKSGTYGSFYCQAISASAPNPYAARLWQEFLYSDQGQLIWLKGFSHPARFDDLAKRKAVPTNLLSALPPADVYSAVKFATAAQVDKAKAVVAKDWGPKVAGA